MTTITETFHMAATDKLELNNRYTKFVISYLNQYPFMGYDTRVGQLQIVTEAEHNVSAIVSATRLASCD